MPVLYWLRSISMRVSFAVLYFAISFPEISVSSSSFILPLIRTVIGPDVGLGKNFISIFSATVRLSVLPVFAAARESRIAAYFMESSAVFAVKSFRLIIAGLSLMLREASIISWAIIALFEK